MGQQGVGHEGVITERDGFCLRPSISNPKESPSRNEDQLIHDIRISKMSSQLMMMSNKKAEHISILCVDDHDVC
ncbi:hypothetical protein [Lysinibacillus sp. Ag94]|uniref:hypothetical protein n=1 Tax=Lysinibacillus sp. Ag94 TaxID=2936682 RepID=UPI00200C1AD1|nr:hypothetical protein [Lysinibacillus sp. Ag94]UPW82614.1 hypothetical protein MY533_18100 [Lysinibacillus sp. Ag94]